MYKNIFFKTLFFAILLNTVVSCDNDSNELGSDIIGGDNFETGTPETYAVVAGNEPTGPVETLDLPINALGVFNNPPFGKTTANVAVQLQMDAASLNPTFDTALHPAIESVTLTIPYFCTKGETNANGETLYTLDSIYGPENSKIKLQVFESKYYIRDLDPNPTSGAQKYYSNQDHEFDVVKGQLLNTSSDASQNDQFVFSPAELQEPGVVTAEDQNPKPIRSAPGMKISLDPAFFTSKIMSAPSGKLLNNNVFKEYFRGLYFRAENSGDDQGRLALLNIKGGKITIKYKQDKTTTTTVNGVTTTTTTREDKSFVLFLNGKSVGFFNNESTLVQNTDNIYLKGGDGSMAVIDLFGPDTNGDGVADKLKELRDNKWLVNDASLTFHINNADMGLAEKPNRIYLYDLKNKRPLVDYYSDQSSASNTKYAKSVHGGIIKKSDGTYKIKITNHIRALINNKDSTNVRLGLVVTESINLIANKKLRATTPTYNISEMPFSSIINPLGTILFGSGNNVPENKRIQLKIYYTKPKQN
ncbi:DUF4270 domain-containing protein [Flavobacterium sp.]|uniref:DUF4270 domain-containing protein n=1 Tax=Flavobacterium sp. TaxID=239 RepID=UPI00260DD833|nr:DUF4270 domain-containing protein [Flavobacterium sp.]